MADASTEPSVAHTITARIAGIRARHPAADIAVLTDVVATILSVISADISANQAILLHEVETLAHTIANARAEIASMSVTEITGRHIPSASDELDAIVSHTAAATETILAACEALDAIIASLSEPTASRLQAATTAIYEACSFQDITGQRLTKVVSVLKAIDVKVASIVASGQHVQALATYPETLASGPQLPNQAMAQADVDQLLADLG